MDKYTSTTTSRQLCDTTTSSQHPVTQQVTQQASNQQVSTNSVLSKLVTAGARACACAYARTREDDGQDGIITPDDLMAIRDAYVTYVGQPMTALVAQAVEAAINENYLQDKHATAEDYSGNLLLVKDIVIRYLRGGVMPYDAAHDAFAVSGLEEPVAYPFRFRAGGRDLEMKFAGIADRIDTLDDGALRVVDYKTGAPHLEFDGVESLFTGTGKQRLSHILQTLLYAMMLHRSRGCDVEPALYYVRNMNRPGYSPQLDDKETGVKGARYTLYRDRFEELLRAQLAELYDTSVPFRQCEDADTCKYCDFNVICKR